MFTSPDPHDIRLNPVQARVQYRYVCPFESGDPEPEQVLFNGDPLIFYQVDDATITLVKDRGNMTIIFYF